MEEKAGLEMGGLLFSVSPTAPGSHANPERREALHTLCGAGRSHSSHVTLPQVLLTALGGIHNLRFGRLCPPNALASLLHLGNTEGEAEDGLKFEGAELGGGGQ